MTITGNPNTQLRKVTTIEYNAPLVASGVFTGQWHDSFEDGTVFVQTNALANQSAQSLAIQESDDINNAGFTRQVGAGTVTGGSLRVISSSIKARFWRVVFTNSTTAQTSLEITTCAMNFEPQIASGDVGSPGGGSVPITAIASPTSTNTLGDNTNFGYISLYSIASQASNDPFLVLPLIFGGAFSGTAQATLQQWSRPRTPTVYKTTTATAAGNTAVWTPGSGNKFRLLRFKFQVTANASLAAAGILTVTFQDSATGLNLNHNFWLPAAAGAAQNLAYDSGWIDLGQFGILSAAANNALNVNLSAALATGEVSVIACGTEE